MSTSGSLTSTSGSLTSTSEPPPQSRSPPPLSLASLPGVPSSYSIQMTDSLDPIQERGRAQEAPLKKAFMMAVDEARKLLRSRADKGIVCNSVNRILLLVTVPLLIQTRL